ncbi:hypothetical protein [Bradyrhizobium sp. BR 1433]|uniref:hypothetical protein n=1 Tax=Bradyrhizobium sp. BR 1433 TaxID=3447967 RepID=UPI003EE432EC
MDYRAIVERHFGKHTGLQHSAKACLNGMLAMEAAGAAGGGEVRASRSLMAPGKQAGAGYRAGSDSGKQEK